MVMGGLSASCLAPGALFAEEPTGNFEDAVVAKAREILGEVEFRYFQHLDDPAAPSDSSTDEAEEDANDNVQPRRQRRAERDRERDGDDEQLERRKTSRRSSAKRTSNEKDNSWAARFLRQLAKYFSQTEEQGPRRQNAQPDANNAPAMNPKPPAEPPGRWNFPDFSLFGAITGSLLQFIAYLVLAVIVAAIFYAAIVTLLGWRRPPATLSLGADGMVEAEAADHPPGATSTDEYLARALELARSGAIQQAVAQLVLGGMSYVERRELIRYRRGLTYRDYQRALRGQDQFESFRTLIQIYEPVGFGRREASLENFKLAVDEYRAAFL